MLISYDYSIENIKRRRRRHDNIEEEDEEEKKRNDQYNTDNKCSQKKPNDNPKNSTHDQLFDLKKKGKQNNN